MANCRRCQAPIKWGKRPGKAPREPGAFVALEPDPSPQGIYVIRDDRVHPIDLADEPELPRWLPHAAMCSAEGQPRRSPLRNERTQP